MNTNDNFSLAVILTKLLGLFTLISAFGQFATLFFSLLRVIMNEGELPQNALQSLSFFAWNQAPAMVVAFIIGVLLVTKAQIILSNCLGINRDNKL